MKQVVIQGGEVRVTDVPPPRAGARSILVCLSHSCISAGTEIAGVQAAAEPLYRRALRQPERVKRAIELLRTHGLRYTLERVRGETHAVPLGYSAAGTVVSVGEEVAYFAPGDRVACAGAGMANHAAVVQIPVNLAVKIPDGVTNEDAATVALGAIALQGLRRAAPQFGETVLVVGLGLLGQLTVQLLRASGCRTLGADLDGARVEIARASGLDAAVPPENYFEGVRWLTDGLGVDAVIVTAASTDDRVINSAIRACRRKGRIVAVGDVALRIDRGELYARELDLLIATSYGPGRNDPAYELEGHDYPLPYVRWTENRNMEAYLRALASGTVRLDTLPRRVTAVDRATEAYAALGGSGQKPLLSLLSYAQPETSASPRIALRASPSNPGVIRVALAGAGSFAQAMHLPNLARLPDMFTLRAVMSRTGMTARLAAERSGAGYATTDFAEILRDPEVDAVVIATRHHLHARLALAALEAGKHVFVEKPLATTPEDLATLERFFAERERAPLLFTGFNRRFSPAMEAARAALADRATPLMASYRMNAGYLPPEHWAHGEEGAGRNIGEACHIYDLFGFLTGSAPAEVQGTAISPHGRDLRRDDNFVATIRYTDGSVCTLTYTALGYERYPKERLDLFAGGMVLVLDDFRRLDVHGSPAKSWSADTPDKGHLAALRAFAKGVRTGEWPLSLADQLAATRVSFEVDACLRRPAA